MLTYLKNLWQAKIKHLKGRSSSYYPSRYCSQYNYNILLFGDNEQDAKTPHVFISTTYETDGSSSKSVSFPQRD